MKACKRCGIEKSVDNFGTYTDNRNNKTYHKTKCKECYNLDSQEFYDINKDEILKNRDPIRVKETNQKYYVDNRDEILIQKREYNKKNEVEISNKNKGRYQNNKEEIISNNSNYKKQNRALVNERNRERRKIDPIFRMRETVRGAIKNTLKRLKNGVSINKYLPYSIEELKDHLEQQFESWMTWDNQGIYDSKTWNDYDSLTWTWQLDHIIPQSDLPYTSMADDNFKKCWAFDNLRPLSAKINVSEGPARIRHKKKVA